MALLLMVKICAQEGFFTFLCKTHLSLHSAHGSRKNEQDHNDTKGNDDPQLQKSDFGF